MLRNYDFESSYASGEKLVAKIEAIVYIES